MKINIIKFGGSVISDNFSENHFNHRNIERLAKEFYPFYEGSILIHGTGHVGKPPAIKYGYATNGIISKEYKLIALEIKSRIRQLNQDIVNTLISASIPAIPLDILHYYTDPVELYDIRMPGMTIQDLLKNGLVPIFYGDLLPKPDGSFKVISSDYLTFILAKSLKPENVIFLSNVKGIYHDKGATKNDADQEIINELTPDKMASIRWSDDDITDVSGGMRRKAELALEISGFCNKCFIGSGYAENILGKVLNGEVVEGIFVKRLNTE
jgi:isopentenyl phosphate kinase